MTKIDAVHHVTHHVCNCVHDSKTLGTGTNLMRTPSDAPIELSRKISLVDDANNDSIRYDSRGIMQLLSYYET